MNAAKAVPKYGSRLASMEGREEGVAEENSLKAPESFRETDGRVERVWRAVVQVGEGEWEMAGLQRWSVWGVSLVLGLEVEVVWCWGREGGEGSECIF